jgi:hypothetical protein
MSDDYQHYHFSATCQTQDAAVLHCLRALCQWAEKWKKPNIGWGGTTQRRWELSGGRLTLRFTNPAYRQNFVDKANELLNGRWAPVGSNDNNPAERQRLPH